MRWLLLACSLTIGGNFLGGQTTNGFVPASGIGRNVLTNQGVAMLARAGYSERFIIDMIFFRQTQFDVSADGLVWLAKQGLTEKIIRVMVKNERKEELTAIVPATIVPAPATPPSPDRKPATVDIEVSFPTPSASNSSWIVTGVEQDRWFVAPNVPAIAVTAR